MALLSIEHLSIDFISHGFTNHAVRDLSLSISKGELLAIVGESGSGKSVTALSILQLLPKPPANYSAGRILFTEGKLSIDLLKADRPTLQNIRGSKIAMIFQEPMSALNPLMTCGRQISEAIIRHQNPGSKAAREQAIAWLDKVKLPEPDKMYNRYPHELSGGQKQRVMIAMAMCCNPSLLICDEPTTALDVTVQRAILDLIRELQKEHQMGVLFITHDLGVVADIADHVAVMYKGALVEQNESKALFQHPHHNYTRALLACRPNNHKKTEKLPTVADFMEERPLVPDHQPEIKKTSSTEVLLEVRDLSVIYPVKTSWLGKPVQVKKAVNQVSFSIYKGETLGLVGESGCGKTTLGRTILQLITPSSGSILFKGNNISSLKKNEVKKLRKEVQLIFQDPFSSLNPRLTIGDALSEPLKVSNLYRSKPERKKRLNELLDQVSLSKNMINRFPHEFSGGQRQRIVIARALALEPDFLVCDESVSALDVSVQAQVLNLLNELKASLGLTLLFISHDLNVVRYMSDRIMVMYQGKIIESGDAEDVYNHPQTNYTKNLIAAIPTL